MKLIKNVSQCCRRRRRSRTDKMYKIDYPFVEVGLQILYNNVYSKIHGLPCRGCNIKKDLRKPRGGLIKKVI
jgi:hypothetical protein